MDIQGRSVKKDTLDGMSGGIFMIGIGVLFLVDEVDFWPWILLVVGLSSVPGSIAHEGFWAGLQGLIWMGGFAFLFHTGAFWPGILILIGLSMMVGAMVRPEFAKKAKRTSVDPGGADAR